MNTKQKGDIAESVIISEFIKNNISVSIPFGDNDKYDLIVELNNQFKSVQIKNGRFENGKIIADIRHRIGKDRINYSTYSDKVDFIAIYCDYNDSCYLIDLKTFGNKTHACLRIDSPKNNSCISTIIWAKDFEFKKILTIFNN